MDETLKKIDQIKDRTGVSYAMAKEALEKSGGSVVDAIIYLEKQAHSPEKKAIEQGKNLWYGLQGAIEKGKDTKIRVLKEGKPVAEVPVAAGVIGLAGALAIPGVAVLGAVGSVVALMNKYSLEVKKNEPPETGPDRENDVDNLT